MLLDKERPVMIVILVDWLAVEGYDRALLIDAKVFNRVNHYRPGHGPLLRPDADAARSDRCQVAHAP